MQALYKMNFLPLPLSKTKIITKTMRFSPQGTKSKDSETFSENSFLIEIKHIAWTKWRRKRIVRSKEVFLGINSFSLGVNRFDVGVNLSERGAEK